MSDRISNEFSIGRILGNSFSILNKNIISFGIMALILMIPNAYFLILPLTGGVITLGAFDNVFGIITVTLLVQIIFSSLLTAMLVYGTFNSIRGQLVSFSQMLSKGLSIVFPVIGLSIVVFLIVGLGTILLIIPGIILFIMFYVAIPVKVIESAGISDCLTRSKSLTDGHKWGIFGLLVIVSIASAVLNMAATSSIAMMGSFIIPSVLLYVLTAYITAFGAVMSAMVYYELRSEKEGIDIDQLSEVFA